MTSERHPKILLLGGTGDAKRTADELSAAGAFDVVASLAGVTRDPMPYPCPTRVGGFGGPEGLAAFLRDEQVDLIIDATHPFAAQMSRHAVAASAATGCPVLRIERPSWTDRLRDELGWNGALQPSFASAARVLPSGACAFLAVGRKELATFADRTDVTRYARTVEPMADALSGAGFRPIVARPPFAEAAERALFTRLGVTHLVTKDAGGDAGWAKLSVAAELGLTIIVVARPAAPHPPAGVQLQRLFGTDGVVPAVRHLLKSPAA